MASSESKLEKRQAQRLVIRVIVHTLHPKLYSIRSDADNDLHRSRESPGVLLHCSKPYTKNCIPEESTHTHKEMWATPPFLIIQMDDGCGTRCCNSHPMASSTSTIDRTALTTRRFSFPRSTTRDRYFRLGLLSCSGSGTGSASTIRLGIIASFPLHARRQASPPIGSICPWNIKGPCPVCFKPSQKRYPGTFDLPYVTPKSSKVQGSDLTAYHGLQFTYF